MEPFRCRACDGPLARSALKCDGCGLVLDWKKLPWRLQFRWPAWRGPDAEFRTYARAQIPSLYVLSALGAFLAAICVCAMVWLPDYYTPEMRLMIEVKLLEEHVEEPIRELVLGGFDDGRSWRNLGDAALWLGIAGSASMAIVAGLMIPVVRRLAAEPADPAAPTGEVVGAGSGVEPTG
jgi:hypothetical protein